MNERIRELAREADGVFIHKLITGAKQYTFLEQDLEKFAQLIVRECALTAGLMEHADRKNIGAGILDRFGVSE